MKTLHKIGVTRAPPKAEVEGSNPFGSASFPVIFSAIRRLATIAGAPEQTTRAPATRRSLMFGVRAKRRCVLRMTVLGTNGFAGRVVFAL